jgi:hypothetical protein
MPMFRTIPVHCLVALATTMALPAQAQCYADYRAKQDNPLRLQYGVAELPVQACANPQVAAQMLEQRLAQGGWIFLDLLSTFGPRRLDQRRERAGQFFLRF